MSLSLGLLGALAGGATGGMLRAGGSRALGAAAGAVGGGLGVSHAMKDVLEEKPNKNEHEIIWSTLVGKPEGPDYKRFLNSSVEDKARILHSHAKDTDDALWRSKEWMKIEGNPEANQHMSLLGYGQKDPFGHGTSIAPSGDPELFGVKKEDVVRY